MLQNGMTNRERSDMFGFGKGGVIPAPPAKSNSLLSGHIAVAGFIMLVAFTLTLIRGKAEFSNYFSSSLASASASTQPR